VVLMVVGIAIFGLLAGSLASFFIERGREKETNPEFAEIVERLERIERALNSAPAEEQDSKPSPHGEFR
jgi:hypothetical protein